MSMLVCNDTNNKGCIDCHIWSISGNNRSRPSHVGMFVKLSCPRDLSVLAFFQVLCIPFVSLRSPSPHLPSLHVGASWSCTHSRHTTCQCAINPATFRFPWGLGATEFLLQSFTAALLEGVSSRHSVSLHSEDTKAQAYHIHFSASIQPGPIRSSGGRQRVNSLVRGVGRVVLYFLSEVEWMSLWCSCLRRNKRERKQKQELRVKFDDNLGSPDGQV